jgi:hypothetical protein
MDQSHRRSPGRAGYPLSSGGLTGEELLRKAMQTPPPEDDPKPPKTKARPKTKKTARKK